MTLHRMMYNNSVIHHAVPKSMTIDEIRAATQEDPILQQLQSIIHTGRWNDRADDAVSQFKHVFNEQRLSYRPVHGRISQLISAAHF